MIQPLSAHENLDNFFYYEMNDLATEIEHDLLLGFYQPQRTLYYNRSDGCGLTARENYPSALLLTVLGRYDIVNWVSNRNNNVADGSDGGNDRRVAVSQNSIQFTMDEAGDIDVVVNYVPFYNFKKPQALAIPVSRS